MKSGEVFNPDERITYLKYLDANNLYGWAMSQPLPVGGFERMTEELGLLIGEMPPCFVKVDLEYPIELHNKFAELVPAPENIIPEGSKVKKLAPNLLPKKGYVCHIDMNTKLRAAATNDADKDMYKLLNNTVFGKTCENLFHRTDYRLVSSRKQALDLIAKPTFKDYTVYNERLAGIHLDLSSVTLNKPSYVGVAVLELSKVLMYRFHYEDVKAKYGGLANLLFTDTDSLCYLIATEDWYDDIREDVPTKYDTSDYSEDHPEGLPRMNKKVIGMMKDEIKGKGMIEFCGNRGKSYSFVVNGGICKKKCKGINKSVMKKELTIDDYKECVLGGEEKTLEQVNFRSHKYEMFTERIRKVALSPYDDKRVVLDDGV